MAKPPKVALAPDGTAMPDRVPYARKSDGVIVMVKVTGTPAPVEGRCGAKLRRSMQKYGHIRYCNLPPMRGRTRCHLCGGKTPNGPNSHAWKHGRRSRSLNGYKVYLKPGQQTSFEQVLNDENLLSLRQEIALTRHRLQEAVGRMDGALGPKCLRAVEVVLESYRLFDKALKTGRAERIGVAREKLDLDMRALTTAFGPERRMADATKDLRTDTLVLERLERAENQRVDEVYTRITAERAYALRVMEHAVFMEVLNEFVPDRATKVNIRRRIAAKFAAIAGSGNRAALDAGRGYVSPAGDSAPLDAGGAAGLSLDDAGDSDPGRGGLPGA